MKAGVMKTSSRTLSSRRRLIHYLVQNIEAKTVCFPCQIVQVLPSFSATVYCASGPWENQQFPVSQYKAVP